MPRRRPGARPRGGVSRPTPFGPYSLITKLGTGGMGVVHLALTRDAAGVRPVVVKRLHPHLLDEEYQVALFRDECRLTTRFDHPNVVRTTDVGIVGGAHYLAMDYLEGRSLLDILRAARAGGRRRIPPAVLCRIVRDVLAGLHYAHELVGEDGEPLGVIHRDVSPGNVFVTAHGVSKLVDFGVAKAATQKNQTKVGTLKGKMSYLAPEQLAGDSFDRRVDLWATGVVLLEALTGQSPFYGENDIDVLQKLMDLDLDVYLDRLISLRWPAGILETARIALQRDPKNRYGTARDMEASLARYLAAVPAAHTDVARFLDGLFHDELERERSTLRDALAAEGAEPQTLSTDIGSPHSPGPGTDRSAGLSSGRARLKTPGTLPALPVRPQGSEAVRQRRHTPGTLPAHPLPPPMPTNSAVPPLKATSPLSSRLVALLAAAVVGILVAWVMESPPRSVAVRTTGDAPEPPQSVPVPWIDLPARAQLDDAVIPKLPVASPPPTARLGQRPARRPERRRDRRPDRH